MSASTKICPGCKVELPLTSEYFQRNRGKKSGFQSRCKRCRGSEYGPEKPSLPTSKPGYKICSQCLIEKPATTEYFTRTSSTQDGLHTKCKTCKAEQDRLYREGNQQKLAQSQKEHYERNKGRILERGKIYREQNKDKKAERDRRYYLANKNDLVAKNRAYRQAKRREIAAQKRRYREANKDKIAERDRAYRRRNKERIEDYQRDWRERNKERVARYSRNWSARNKSAKSAARARRRALLYNAEGYHTAGDIQRQYGIQKGRCYYCKVKLFSAYHIDHLVPLSRGGTNWPDNIVIACPSCNCKKNNKLPHEWSQGGRLL